MRTPDPWDSIFLTMAYVISKRSKDPNTQVGAILVSEDKRRMSSGYNGFPTGMKENAELWKRPVKYSYVCHAEINAILQARTDLTNWTLYVTMPCCSDCAKYVVQSGIGRVVFCEEPKPSSQLDYELANKMFESAGITVEQKCCPQLPRLKGS